MDDAVLTNLRPDTAYTLQIRTCEVDVDSGGLNCDGRVTIEASTRPSNSNTITFPDEPPAPSLALRISWGSDASNRQDCPANTDCRNLSYDYIGDWPAPPYWVEGWGNGQRLFGPVQWTGRPHTGCYYWGGTAQVVINGVRSNTITFPDTR